MSEELTQRYLTLVKIDSENLMDRIVSRQNDYLNEFSLKRDRAVFVEIFNHRYSSTTMNDLAQLPIEIIELANDFYTHVDELKWYLMHTQDMPNTIQEEIIRKTNLLEKKSKNLSLYIDVELSGKPMMEQEEEFEGVIEEEFVSEEDTFQEEFVDDGENTREINISHLDRDQTASFKIEDYDLEDDS